MTAAAANVMVVILRVLLAWILVRAGLHKLRARPQFLGQLRAYRLLPEALLPLVALPLAMAELLTAVTLMNLDWSLPTLIAAALFALYGMAMVVNLARGRTDLGCGCGGPLAERGRIDWTLVARNTVLTALALLAFVGATPRLSPMDYLTVFFGGAAALLLYEAAEHALAHRQRVAAWQQRHVLRL